MSDEKYTPNNEQELGADELDQVAGGALSRPASNQLKIAYNPQAFNPGGIIPCIQPGEIIPCVQPGEDS
jgi:hypothetical protein